MNLSKAVIDQTLHSLAKGQIILYPTDTIWGIGCDATNAEAIKRIYVLKKREVKKSMIILVSDQEMLIKYVSAPSPKILSYLSLQKTPTTAVFKGAIHLPRGLINEDGTVAIRIVKDDFCRALINQLKKPLVSTSANISGEIYPANFLKVSDEIKNGVDFIVPHRQEEMNLYSPSCIIKLNEEDEIVMIR